MGLLWGLHLRFGADGNNGRVALLISPLSLSFTGYNTPHLPHRTSILLYSPQSSSIIYPYLGTRAGDAGSLSRRHFQQAQRSQSSKVKARPLLRSLWHHVGC